MVVMDAVKGQDARSHYPNNGGLSARVKADVRVALVVLHQNHTVFGDLRRPNIMIVSRDDSPSQEGVLSSPPAKKPKLDDTFGAMLVDFDWAGVAGQTAYTLFLDDSGRITGRKA